MSSKPIIIPWLCLQDASPEKIVPNSNQIKNKTFAQALTNVCDIPMSQLPKISVKGNNHAITIPEDEYEIGMETCKFNLHARIIWPKGSTPLSTFALREKLKAIWKSFGRWGISFIGKGYYELCFSSIEDARRARSVGSLNLNPGLMKFFVWTRDFNPSTQVNSLAQVWLRIYGLPQEYWRPKILFAIASSAGNPICTDANTGKSMFDRTFGLFARVLIDIDLEKERLYKVLVERKGFAMFVDLNYEQIPEFCTSCRTIGHQMNNCRKNARNDIINSGKNQKTNLDKGKSKETDVDKNQGEVNVETEFVDLDKELTAQLPPKVTNNPRPSKWVRKENEVIPVTNDSRALVDNEDNGNVDVCGTEKGNVYVDDLDDSSSQASEFVDATQMNEEESPSQNLNLKETTPVRSPSQSPTQNEPTPLRIQNDMLFLTESWANLAEIQPDDDISEPIANSDVERQAEEQKSIEKEIDEELLREDQQNIEASGFQLVTSRTKKRAQKSKKSSVKSSYGTRTKPSSPKPFK